MLQPYRDVLTRPGALAFSGAGVVARLPMSMVGIGIVLMVSSLYGSYGLAGRVSAVYVIAQALCSPQLARFVDRYGQARIMRPAIAVSSVGLTALVAAAVSHAHPALLYVTALVTGAAIGSFGSLARARWFHVLDDPQHVHTAYSLESALDELVFIVGPVAATLLATGVSPGAGLVVPLVAVIGGGFWFLSLRATEPPAHPEHAEHARGSVLASGGMRVLVVVFVGVGAIFGATDVSTVAFSQEQGHKGLAGVVLAVFALGSLLSGLAYGAPSWASPLWNRFVLGSVALAIGASLFVLVGSMVVLAAVMFVVGFAIAPLLINGNNLVQQFVAHTRLTEGLTWVGTALGIGVSFGSSIAGAAIDGSGSHGGFLVVVASAALVVLAAVASVRTLRSGNVAEDLPDD